VSNSTITNHISINTNKRSVAGTGIARTYHLTRLGLVYDTSWEGFSLFAWSIVELQLSIICACTPSMRAFFRRYLVDSVNRYRSNGSRTRGRGDVKIGSSGGMGQRPSRGYGQGRNGDAVDLHVLTRPSSEVTYEGRSWIGDMELTPPAGAAQYAKGQSAE